MDLKSTYDRIAEDYNKDHAGDMWSVEVTKKFAELLSESGTVLDAGCGSGLKSKELVEMGFRVRGIDLSERMIEIARRQVPKAHFSVMDLYDLSGIQEQFDGVYAQAVLLHIPKKDVKAIIGVLVTKLKPGGYFYGAVKERRSDEEEEEMVREDDYGYEYERFFSYYFLEEFENYLMEEGLDIIYKASVSSGRRKWIQVIGKLPE